MKKLFIVLLFILIPVVLFGQDTVTFAWDLSASEPLGAGGGYNLYISKQSGSYGPGNVAGSVGEAVTTVTISSTTYRGRYYAVATAFILENGEVHESGYSNEVTFVIKPNPPTNLRKVTDVALTPVKKAKSLWAAIFGKGKASNLQILAMN